MNVQHAMRLSQVGAAVFLHPSLDFEVPGGRLGRPAVFVCDGAGLLVNGVTFSWSDAHFDARFDLVVRSERWQPVDPKPPLVVIAEAAAKLRAQRRL